MLPVQQVLPDLIAALKQEGRAVLEAPPGAGKTTLVPLALLDSGLFRGKIVMLEPRRLAARTAAERMASLLGETLGKRVGYTIRGKAKTSKDTRIEVVTEAILIRRLQRDPELSGVSAIIFDEFHERSLNSDLGLALALDCIAELRDDLLLLVMSATLDAAPISALMGGAPCIRAQGRSFPVQTRWLERPRRAGGRALEIDMAALIVTAFKETSGSLLAFLPGEREIRKTERILAGQLAGDVLLHPLYSGLAFSAQQRAIRPDREKRRIILATSIAETSLTIPDVRVVVDSGMARRSVFDPTTGMSRLVTQIASKAEATQRQGRAGRIGPGICFRLWARSEEGKMPLFAPPEIETTDLAPLVLALADWGVKKEKMAFLTQPPAGAFAAGQALLRNLDAMDEKGQLSTHGRAIARLPLHPRLAHMLLKAGPSAASLAALLSEQTRVAGEGYDLELCLRAIDENDPMHERRAGLSSVELKQLRKERERLAGLLLDTTKAPPTRLSPAQALFFAFPDRVGQRRSGKDPRWIFSGGGGGQMPPESPLAEAPFLIAATLQKAKPEDRIRTGLMIDEISLRAVAGAQIKWIETCFWDNRAGKITVERQERLGALVLGRTPWASAGHAAISVALKQAFQQRGMNLFSCPPKFQNFQARVAFVRKTNPDAFPDFSDPGILSNLEKWTDLSNCRSEKDFAELDMLALLKAHLGWDRMQRLEALAPASYRLANGKSCSISYGNDEGPEIQARLQDFLGLKHHPTIGDGPLALRVTLLSPAGRPLQTTQDLPGFWQTSYKDVRRDMRGRYPKHAWPENPLNAIPLPDKTNRKKKRST